MDSAPIKVLVVDDNPANLSFITQFLVSQGWRVITAATGAGGLAQFHEQRPDIVLMDILLPDIDGRDVTRAIKESTKESWVPIIYMTALCSESDQINALEAGGDDYITKPVNLRILRARMDAMRRIAEMQRHLAHTTQQLAHFKARAEHEQDIARELMARLIYADRLNDPLLAIWQEPADGFSGDLIAATRSTADRLYLMVADSTGHGLAAALPLLQLSQIFYAMAERGFSLSTITEEMNNKTLARMPVDRFVAGVLVMLDPHNRLLEVWTGGNPPPFFISDDGQVIHPFMSQHMPLGIESASDFCAFTQVYQWPCAGHMVVFTDGLVEPTDAQGDAFGDDRVLQILSRTPPPARLAALQEMLRAHLGPAKLHDDVSLVLIRCEV